MGWRLRADVDAYYRCLHQIAGSFDSCRVQLGNQTTVLAFGWVVVVQVKRRMATAPHEATLASRVVSRVVLYRLNNLDGNAIKEENPKFLGEFWHMLREFLYTTHGNDEHTPLSDLKHFC